MTGEPDKKYFYDPRFAVATSVLAAITWPIFVLALDDIERGSVATVCFMVLVLIMMLCASWSMAREDQNR